MKNMQYIIIINTFILYVNNNNYDMHKSQTMLSLCTQVAGENNGNVTYIPFRSYLHNNTLSEQQLYYSFPNLKTI